MMYFTKRILPLLVTLMPLSVYSQVQSTVQKEQKNAMTDSEQVQLIMFLLKNSESLVIPILTVC